MSVRLRPMRDEEFAEWLPRMRDRYAEDMVQHGGFGAESARVKAYADVEAVFPGGVVSDEQFVFVVETHDGLRVGELWLGVRDDAVGRVLWVYNVRIDERFRGRGFGRAAMLLVEAEAQQRGFGRVALNVFGGNDVARTLYRSLEYEELAVVMSKHV